jgi:hypothetical protein
MMRNHRSLCAGVLVLAALATVASAGTVTITREGGGRSATAEITFGAGKIDVVLGNTTEHTYDASYLLTGFRLTLADVTANGSLSSATADTIDVASDGTYTVDGTDVDLLDIGGKASWSVVNVSSGVFELRFNPDAEHAIIGPPESDDTYSLANGSILGNDGHNPFADREASFTLGLNGVTSSTTLDSSVFLFGTDFGVTLVPLPSAAWAGLALLGGLLVISGIRRRRSRS